jgi:DNA-binding PucR family transcriptional regulator
MTTKPEDLVETAIQQALAIDDPALRGRTITRILKAVEDDKRLKDARATDVRELRQAHTLKEVAELVELSIGRVDQIAKGTITGRRAKAAERTGT